MIKPEPFATSLGIDSNIDPTPPHIEPPEEHVIESEDFEVVENEDFDSRLPVIRTSDEKEDYNVSRKTLKSVINIGDKAMEELAQIASGTEQPRAYEVLAQIMKQMSETSKDLYGLQKTSKEIREGLGGKPAPINVDKAVFVGSPTDMLDRIERQEADKNVD